MQCTPRAMDIILGSCRTGVGCGCSASASRPSCDTDSTCQPLMLPLTTDGYDLMTIADTPSCTWEKRLLPQRYAWPSLSIAAAPIATQIVTCCCDSYHPAPRQDAQHAGELAGHAVEVSRQSIPT